MAMVDALVGSGVLTIVGGGNSVAAVMQSGNAFPRVAAPLLELLEGVPSPGIVALEQS